MYRNQSNPMYDKYGIFVYAILTQETLTKLIDWSWQNKLNLIRPPYGYLHTSIFKSGRSQRVELNTFAPPVRVRHENLTIATDSTTGHVILVFDHAYFKNRHKKLSKEFGQRPDEGYIPHMTLCWDR